MWEKRKSSLGVAEQVAREVREQRSYKALRRKRSRPATRRGLMPTTWSGGFPVRSPRRGPPTILTQSLSLNFWVRWWFGAPVGSRGHPWVSSVRAATEALPLETCRGPQVVPMRSEIIKNKNVGPPRSPTLAPLVGVGTDFKPRHPGVGPLRTHRGLVPMLLGG